MQNSFPYIDILIFGVIAIFLIFRLKNILGTKTGFEKTNVNEKEQNKIFLIESQNILMYNAIPLDGGE